MKYEIIASDIFNKWLHSLDSQITNRILARLFRVENGNFGDHKQLDNDIFELRLFFGSGYRIYYTVQNNQIIILLNGGDKKTQNKDIVKAKKILKEWKNDKF
jgi:putative addiction module killer protein